MDEPQAVEETIPGATATVEEIETPAGPAEIIVIEGQEPERPHDDLDVGYRFGRMETRLVELEKRNDALLAQLAAFEAATIQAVTEEAMELEQQGEVIAAVAEEVLPQDHEAASEHNPSHGTRKPRWWEALTGGHHPPRG